MTCNIILEHLSIRPKEEPSFLPSSATRRALALERAASDVASAKAIQMHFIPLRSPRSLASTRAALLSTALFAAAGCSDTQDPPNGHAHSESDASAPPPDAGSHTPTKPVTDDSGVVVDDRNDAGALTDAGATILADAGEVWDGATAINVDAGSERPPAIEKEFDRVLTFANDLRGLTYAKSGKIYVSGHSDADPNDRSLVVARLNSDGSPDPAFGVGGVVTYNATVGDEQSPAIVELSNGDVVVQANLSDGKGGALVSDMGGGAPAPLPSGTDVVLIRFDKTGKLVASFGDGGRQVVDFGWSSADDVNWPTPDYDSTRLGNNKWSGSGFPNDTGWDIQLDRSGAQEKIVVFGHGPAPMGSLNGETQRLDNDRYVVRVLAFSGADDPSFNRDGSPFSFNTLSTFSDGARRGLVEPDGSIVSTGYTNFGTGFGNHVVLLRLKPDGTADESFGFGLAAPGATRFNPFIDDGGFAECYAVARQSSGRYVTTGYGRATAAGLRSRYGYATSDGVDLVSFGLTERGLDPTYGISGTRAIQSEEFALGDTEDRGRHLLVLADDRIVQVGRFGGNPTAFVLTKDGELDKSVGDGGRFEYEPFSGTTSHFFAVAASPDGSRLAATTSNHADGVRLAVLRVGDD